MVDFKQIYTQQAERYDRMVASEDYQGNILWALLQIRPFPVDTVVDVGAGTGRIARLLAPHAKRTYAFDIAEPMLRVAQNNSMKELALADNRRLPLGTAVADVCIAGWSLGHFVGWYPQTWQTEIGHVLAEMQRVTQAGGQIIILETLGTGIETPQPPTPGLAAYYNWLQYKHGFAHKWIRTDYRFESVNAADELTRYFFGDELGDRIQAEKLIHLPECTGIWWLTQ